MSHDVRGTSFKIAQRLRLIEPFAYRLRQSLPPFRYRGLASAVADPLLGADVVDDDWTALASGDSWGAPRTDFVLRTRFRVPDDWDRDPAIALHLPLGVAGDFSHPEALVYVDGRPHAGCDRHHQEIPLPAAAHDDGWHRLALHGWTGGTGESWGRERPPRALVMGECELVQIDQPTRDFVALARVALGVADALPASDPVRHRLQSVLDAAFLVLDTREPIGEAFYASVPTAHQRLAADVAAAGAALDVDIRAVGHAHLDVAWLWPVSQTRRKAGRTFHTVARLMELFPEFHYTQSQPQLYEYIRQDHPDLLETIRKRVAEGRWEPIGGMWVEADCNISGAEALARQLLLGRTFFREHFGDADSPVLWLPDAFGFASNLPQLAKLAGLDCFFTTKLSWNQYNRMPYDSFWWQGLDGTRILAHMSPTPSGERSERTTYNATARPVDVLGTWTNYQQKETRAPLLMSYGWGDGGGGPTREMVESLGVMGDFPSTPRVTRGTAAEFFRDLEAVAADLPTWNGELYLEYHRGTYTSQAAAKRDNRKSELLLHDAEFVAALASVVAEHPYPAAELTEAWKLLCLNQFHDILPGSSIGEVYADATRDYETISRIGTRARDRAIAALPVDGDVTAVNPTSFGGPAVGFLAERLQPGTTLAMRHGTPLVSQAVAGGTLVQLPDVPAYGFAALRHVRSSPTPTGGPVVGRVGDGVVMENGLTRVELDGSGEITRLYDKEVGREVLPAGARANVFQAFEDRPLAFDAWDVDIYFDDREWGPAPAHHVEVVERGPLRVGVEFRRRIGRSEITQRIRLWRDGRRVDFDTTVDWRERHTLLKVAFPVEVLSPTATYDIQWGNVARPTHRNTSWDWARFESCAHKWVDLSEGDYGVSLLNDCKYGHDVSGNVIRLTLLRSPTFPDPEADQGEHRFTYSLLPHPGDWRNGTVRAAYALNDPVIMASVEPHRAGEHRASLLSADAPNVVIETVKRAEDGEGLIVRLYENERCRGPVTLRTGFRLAAAYPCNLLEEQDHAQSCQLAAGGRAVAFDIGPYQIVTLRLIPDQSR